MTIISNTYGQLIIHPELGEKLGLKDGQKVGRLLANKIALLNEEYDRWIFDIHRYQVENGVYKLKP